MSELRTADQAHAIHCQAIPPASDPEVGTPVEPVNKRRPLALSLAVLGAVAGALVRLVPHGWNLSPSYAAELYAGARLRAWQAFALALGVRAVTDLIIFCTPFRGQEDSSWFYLTIMPWVYLSIALNVCLGRLVRRTDVAWKIGGITLLASLQFFIVTNFGSWLGSPVYPKTVVGLIECYVAAIPWFAPSLISYLVFVPVLFGAHAALSRSLFPREQVAPTIV
jgi:hypothetical protein